jgi:hypothetical protein
MWKPFKNIGSRTVHAVSLPSGMSPHGFAMNWALAETPESVTCHLCLLFAHQWRNRNPELKALLPANVAGRRVNPMADRLEAKYE